MVSSVIFLACISLTLSELVEETLRNNPQVASVKAELEASWYEVRYSRFPENPEIEFSQNLGFSFMIKQSIPFPSKLKKKKEISARLSDEKYWNFQRVRMRILRELKESYYTLWFLTSQYELLQSKVKRLFEDLESLSKVRYEVGEDTLQGILRVQVEKLRIEQKMIEISAQIEEQKAKVVALVGKSVKFDKIEYFEYPKIGLDVEDLERIAENNSPLINLARASEKVALYKLELAKVEPLPNFGLGAGVMIYQGEAMPAFGIGIEIPIFLFWKENEGIREARKLHASSYLSYLDTRNNVIARIKTLYELIRASENFIKLYENFLIPQVRNSLESARSAYTVGKIGFSAVLENALLLILYEVEFLREKANLGIYSAMLEEIVGADLGSGLNNLK